MSSSMHAALTARAKRFANKEPEPMVNCSHCMDLVMMIDTSTDGSSILCKECARDLVILGAKLLPMKEEYLCEICTGLLLGDRFAVEKWDGVSKRSSLCDECIAKYTKQRSTDAIDGLRDIIGDE